MSDRTKAWLTAVIEVFNSYRRMIDASISQLTDEELSFKPAEEFNSVAVILRHLGGNLTSRWTDFLTTDGEKPDRNRDQEFQNWEGDRDSLIAYFDRGWRSFVEAIGELNDQNIDSIVLIRGEKHTIQQAIMRSITHTSYHVGQITLVSRLVDRGEWKWLTIAPGKSSQHNQNTWGTAASRAVFASNKGEKS